MEKTYHSLKDFELSYGKNAIERANDFQQYIEIGRASCRERV